MTTIIVTRLSDLRPGDRLLAVNGRQRTRPLTVEAPLGPIEPGSPVDGVRFHKHNPEDIDMVFYPGQMDGSIMQIERPESGEAARIAAVARLAFARKQHPELGRAEAAARTQLAATIMTMDEADEAPGVHSLNEQAAVEHAKNAYSQALADLLRGEAA